MNDPVDRKDVLDIAHFCKQDKHNHNINQTMLHINISRCLDQRWQRRLLEGSSLLEK